MGATLGVFAAAALLWTGPPSAGAAEPIWRLEQPAPPAGVPFKVPLGSPGDLKCWAVNRCLLSVAGNDTVPRGIFSWDGRSWHQLATVCGGNADTSRIAWAGPQEFWVISTPSPPRAGSGLALCRFADGEVAGSWSTRVDAADPFRLMFAAGCAGVNACWFAGTGSQDPLGERIGGFHVRWDGTELRTFYGSQGRGVSDLQFHGGVLYESTLAGRSHENRFDAVDLAEPEPVPRLIHRVGSGPTFANDPFEPASLAGVPIDGTELLALDGSGSELWAVGGGAASGPAVPESGVVGRGPIAARLVAGAFDELELTGATFAPSVRFGDVAVIPGDDAAWVTAVPFAERRSTNSKAAIARIESDGTTTTTRLPAAGSGRGSAAHIACPAANECWLVTWAGWLFHYSDGTQLAQDTDPAFAGTIEFRPNESAEQFVPDTPPDDDSDLFKPPPLEPLPDEKPPKQPPLLKDVKTKLRGKHRLVVTFFARRPARVQLIAKHKREVVGRTPMRKFKRGPGKLVLRVTRKRYPTALDFNVKEPAR